MKTAWQKWTACLLATLMVLGSVFAGPGVAAWAAGPDDGNAAALPSSAAEPGRETINFNNDWLYYKGDITGAEAVDFEDSEWLYVNLPHSTIHYTPDNYYQKDLGVFWYRKHFTVRRKCRAKSSTSPLRRRCRPRKCGSMGRKSAPIRAATPRL